MLTDVWITPAALGITSAAVGITSTVVSSTVFVRQKQVVIAVSLKRVRN